MENKKELVIILGPHAVGKMTVGRELAAMTGLCLFHNHISIEMVRQIYSDSRSLAARKLNGIIRQEVFKSVAESDTKGLIFTYMFAFDVPSEYEYVNGIIGLFSEHGAKCCVIELSADFQVRLVRNRTEERLYYKESKRDLEGSEAEMRATSQKYRLNSLEGEELPFENYMKLDNTDLDPRTVAAMIKEHFDL